MKRSPRRPARGPRRADPAALAEERGLPIVRELARIAGGRAAPAAKLEGALEVLFGAYASDDSQLAALLLGGWMRAREDKQVRLTMAWLREQVRLSFQEILAEGVAAGAFRPALAPGATASAIVGAAEGCLLQSPAHGGPVEAAEIVRALLLLVAHRA